jgi:hypothetical protein
LSNFPPSQELKTDEALLLSNFQYPTGGLHIKIIFPQTKPISIGVAYNDLLAQQPALSAVLFARLIKTKNYFLRMLSLSVSAT